MTQALSLAMLAIMGGTPKAAPITSKDLFQHLALRDSNLRAIALEYKEVPRSGAGRLPGSYVRRFIAARGPNRFMRDNAHGHVGIDWHDDPLRKTLYVNPTEKLLFANLNRVLTKVHVSSPDEARKEAADELIFRVLCWWPFTEWKTPTSWGHQWTLGSLAQGQYKLRPGVEVVLGHTCYVLEDPGSDIIWIDSDSLGCIVRREIYNKKTGRIASRYEYSSYSEVAIGIWLPKSFRSTQFDSYAHNDELAARQVLDTRFDMNYKAINEAVNDSFFEFRLPPGTVSKVNEGEKERIELLAKGEDQFAITMLHWAEQMRNYKTDFIEVVRCITAFTVGFAICSLLRPVVGKTVLRYYASLKG
jgi:hypothetical protein